MQKRQFLERVFGTSYTVKIFKNLEITKITINDAGEQQNFSMRSSVSVWYSIIARYPGNLRSTTLSNRLINHFSVWDLSSLALLRHCERLVESLVVPHGDLNYLASFTYQDLLPQSTLNLSTLLLYSFKINENIVRFS